MFVGAAIKNQKQQKRQKTHMQTILNEIKVKSKIEGIEIQSIIDRTFDQLLRPHKKHFPVSLDSSFSSSNPTPRKGKLPRKGRSKVSLKLEEIVKYAEKFPLPKTKQISEMKKTIEFLKMTPFQAKPIKLQRRRGFIFRRQELPQAKINKELLLDFDVENRNDVGEMCTLPGGQRQNQYQKKIKKLIQEHKEVQSKQDDFSIKNFIEEGKRNQIKKRSHIFSRKTAEEKFQNLENKQNANRVSHSFSDKKTVDIRGENILKLQKFIKGDGLNDDEFSDYVSLRDMEKSCHNYGIYDSIHKKIKKNLTKEKINPKILKEQTLRNVIYLSQSIKQQTNMEKKKQVKLAMKRLKITQ